MQKADEYISEIERLIGEIKAKERGGIEAAAAACADALCSGGMIFVFGAGHSHILAEELFYRAGGLVRVYPILDAPLMLHVSAVRSSQVERLHGYAETLLDNIDCIKSGDAMLLCSNSGRNAVCVDMALIAHRKGLKTICVTSLTHSGQTESRHISGKRLYEACDIVIDNHGCVGDASICVGGDKVGPTSTVIGAMIIQAIAVRTAEMMNERGAESEIFSSANSDGGDAKNSCYIKKYKPIIKYL